jgi:hypothetical protein
MKIKESVYEISDVINKPPLYQTHLLFSLAFWLVVISISLSCVSQPVKAGTEDAGLYYRYVPYQGPSSTTGAGSQATQQPSGASGEQAKKTEQSTGTGGGAGQATAGGQSTQQGSQDVNRQTTQQGSQDIQQGSQGAAGQSTQQANVPKTECPMSAEQRPPVQRPEQGTGEFPSGTYPTFCQADVNGDHYITKDELQNFPELLRVFDKVDAGKDGKLEQHEFANLEMETSREGEI